RATETLQPGARRDVVAHVLNREIGSRKGALQFFVDPPYDSFPGRCELRHLLVLLKRDRRDDLIFGRASRNLSLDSVSYLDEAPPHAVGAGSRSLRDARCVTKP